MKELEDWKERKMMLDFLYDFGWMPTKAELESEIAGYNLEQNYEKWKVDNLFKKTNHLVIDKINDKLYKQDIIEKIHKLRKYSYFDKAADLIEKQDSKLSFFERIKKMLKEGSPFDRAINLRNKMILDEAELYIKAKK